MGFSQMVETVTCCSAGTSSSAESFTALLARPEFSLSSTHVWLAYSYIFFDNLYLVDFEHCFDGFLELSGEEMVGGR